MWMYTCLDRSPQCTTEGQQLRYCGVGAGFDDVIVDGNVDELKVRVLATCEQVHMLTCRLAVCCVLCEGREGSCSCQARILRSREVVRLDPEPTIAFTVCNAILS